MHLIKVLTIGSLLGAFVLGSVLGVGVEASKVGKVKLLGEHGLGMVTTPGGYDDDHAELNARGASGATSGASPGLFRGIKEAAMAILGRQDAQDDVSNVLFGANSAIMTVTIMETCGTLGSLTTYTSPSGSYLYPEATTIKTCPLGSCYDGLVSEPTKATYVPGTIDLPGTTVSTPATTDAPKIPSSTISKQTTVSSTTTNTIRNATNSTSDSTPTNYGPTAPPTAFEPVTGAASKKGINVYLGGALIGLLL